MNSLPAASDSPQPRDGAMSRRRFMQLGGTGAVASLVAANSVAAALTGQDAAPTTRTAAPLLPAERKATFDKLVGPLGPVMPAFHDDDTLDLESTTRWVDWMIASGFRLFWTTYGTSNYMCLTDDEILALNRAVAEAARHRAVFIASTNYNWPVSKCLEFIDQMRAAGASAVKLQIDWSLGPSDNAVFAFYEAIARETSLPLLAHTRAVSPKKGMSNKLLERILTLKPFIGMKNDSGDFYEQCAYLRRVRHAQADFAVMTGGSFASFLHGHEFGQRAFATGVGMMLPHGAIAFSQAVLEGRRADAVQLIKELEEPLNDVYESVGVTPWACFHTVYKMKGLFKSDKMRYPLLTTQPSDLKIIEALAASPAWAKFSA